MGTATQSSKEDSKDGCFEFVKNPGFFTTIFTLPLIVSVIREYE